MSVGTWVAVSVGTVVASVVAAVVGWVVGRVVTAVGVVVTPVSGRMVLFTSFRLRQPVNRVAQSTSANAGIIYFFTVISSFFVFSSSISGNVRFRLGNPATFQVTQKRKEKLENCNFTCCYFRVDYV